MGVVRTQEHPFVLCLDGHISHDSFKLFSWCRENHIVLTKFLPNATHVIQMADVGIFGPGKSVYTKEVQTWKQINNNRELTEADFVKILKIVIDKVMKPESIINGFRATGIFPLCSANVHLDRCIGAEPRKDPKESTIEDENIEEQPLIDYINEQPLCDDVFELYEEPPLVHDGLDFGAINEEPQDHGSLPTYENKLTTLQEALNSVRDSTFHPSLMFSINVMQQQLNFIKNETLSVHSALPLSTLNPPAATLSLAAPLSKQAALKSLLTPPPEFHRAGKHRRYARKNFGVMTTDEVLTQCQKLADDKQEAETAKVERKNVREEKKRQRDVILTIKNEKNEERKAKRRKAEEERKHKLQAQIDVPEKIVTAKRRGRPPKTHIL